MRHLSIAALLLALSTLARAAPIDIGSRIEMFIDEHLIDRKQNVELHLTEPTRREVVFQLDQPWEGPTSAYFTVMRDGGKIRLYYRGSSFNRDDHAFTCYAESDDGIHFTRPDLGLVDFNGSTKNNILFAGAHSASFAPFRDANPKAEPDEKYKALCYEVVERHGTMTAMASPDGIRWRKMKQGSVVPPGEYDSLNCVSWDAIDQQYRVFDRYWTGGGYSGVRAIESRTSDDFLTWSDPTPNRYADGVPLEHFYTSATIRCPGAEHHWLAFPMRFIPERKKVESHGHTGVSDALFMSSRDGVNWDRPFLQAWVRPGLDEKNWTERSNMPAWGIVQLDDEPQTFSLYISEHYRWPTNRLRRLTVRRHGFASMRAGASGGEFVTRPLKFTGSALLLNYATSAAGALQVEIQDDAGQPISGFSQDDCEMIFGDELERAVRWKGGDLSAVSGRVVRLRFVMRDADVFAMRFGEAK